MTQSRNARFALGQIVRHKEATFQGVIVDVDPAYAGPAGSPGPDLRDQPFYRVLAIGADAGFLIYAAENVLEPEKRVSPLSASDHAQWFNVDAGGRLAPRSQPMH
jgi:heat shock protein HspQ